jgi:hypothetical protein
MAHRGYSSRQYNTIFLHLPPYAFRRAGEVLSTSVRSSSVKMEENVELMTSRREERRQEMWEGEEEEDEEDMVLLFLAMVL